MVLRVKKLRLSNSKILIIHRQIEYKIQEWKYFFLRVFKETIHCFLASSVTVEKIWWHFYSSSSLYMRPVFFSMEDFSFSLHPRCSQTYNDVPEHECHLLCKAFIRNAYFNLDINVIQLLCSVLIIYLVILPPWFSLLPLCWTHSTQVRDLLDWSSTFLTFSHIFPHPFDLRLRYPSYWIFHIWIKFLISILNSLNNPFYSLLFLSHWCSYLLLSL